MPIRIKNAKVGKMTDELASMTGEIKTEAVRRAVEERKARLAYRVSKDDRGARLRRFLDQEAWPLVPRRELGRRLSRAEEQAFLGYGEGTGTKPR